MKLLAILFSLVVVACSTPHTNTSESIKLDQPEFYQETFDNAILNGPNAVLDPAVFGMVGANHMMVLPIDALDGVEWSGIEGCQYSNMTPGRIDCSFSGGICQIKIRLSADQMGNWFLLSKECDGSAIMNTVSIGGTAYVVLYYDTWTVAP